MTCPILRADLRASLASVSRVIQPEPHPYNQAERQQSENCVYPTPTQKAKRFMARWVRWAEPQGCLRRSDAVQSRQLALWLPSASLEAGKREEW